MPRKSQQSGPKVSKKAGLDQSPVAEAEKLADSGEKTRGKHAPWQPGESGNPAGRPKGSRHKLGEAFIEALHADFAEHGVKVIETVRAEKPDQYLKVVASLLPKQIEIKEGAFDGVSDEELAALVAAARSALGVAPQGAGGDETAVGPKPPGGLPTLQ